MTSVGTTWDVAVIGAGAFGSWTAYELAKAGQRVLLVDAYGPGNPLSSSGAESRIMRAAYGASEIYTRFARESLPAWLEVSSELFLKTGVLWLGPRGGDRLAASQVAMRNAGVDFQSLTESQIRERYPQIDPGVDVEAILEPDGGLLIADRAVQAVVKAACKLGVEFLKQTVPYPLSRIMEGDQIGAGTYVFACGAWLPKMFPDVLGTLIRPTLQEHFFFRAPDEFSSSRFPAWIDDTDPRMPYGVPDIGGQGLKMGFHREGPPFDPDTSDRLVSPGVVEEARDYVKVRFPSLSRAPLTGARVCQYENSPAGDFLIDRHPAFDNVWFAGGGSGHGYKHGPAVGKYVAGRILGTTGELAPFSLAAAIRSGPRCML